MLTHGALFSEIKMACSSVFAIFAGYRLKQFRTFSNKRLYSNLQCLIKNFVVIGRDQIKIGREISMEEYFSEFSS